MRRKGGTFMEAKIRELKNRLSYYLRRVREGDSVVVFDRSTAVARIEPIRDGALPAVSEPVARLLESGELLWGGGKPEGIPVSEARPSASLSDFVSEDRR